MGKTNDRRIHFLDELRGFTVILMVIYHACYILGYMFDVSFCRAVFDLFKRDVPLQPFFAGLFILICGISCNLSRSNLKRGLLLAGVAALISLCVWCAIFWGILDRSSYIWFGILHCLATCILLYALIRPTLSLIPPWIGVLLSAALLAVCFHVPAEYGGYFGIQGLFTIAVPEAAPNTPFLYPFGLCPVYNAADYFPLLPWFFCFLLGTFIGVWAKNGKFPKWTYRSRMPFLSSVGRYTLWIYMFHQPVVYGICFGIFTLIDKLH